MAVDDTLKNIEERLARLEAARLDTPQPSPWFRFGPITDPATIDLGRLSVSQLESALHSVHAEKARLASMETLINQHLERVKQPG
jgi:hypothetical protein